MLVVIRYVEMNNLFYHNIHLEVAYMHQNCDLEGVPMHGLDFIFLFESVILGKVNEGNSCIGQELSKRLLKLFSLPSINEILMNKLLIVRMKHMEKLTKGQFLVQKILSFLYSPFLIATSNNISIDHFFEIFKNFDGHLLQILLDNFCQTQGNFLVLQSTQLPIK